MGKSWIETICEGNPRRNCVLERAKRIVDNLCWFPLRWHCRVWTTNWRWMILIESLPTARIYVEYLIVSTNPLSPVYNKNACINLHYWHKYINTNQLLKLIMCYRNVIYFTILYMICIQYIHYIHIIYLSLKTVNYIIVWCHLF